MSFYSPSSQQLNELYIDFNDNAGNARFKIDIPITRHTASFYPDTSLSEKEQQEKLRNQIYDCMMNRSKMSDFEMIKYIKRGKKE